MKNKRKWKIKRIVVALLLVVVLIAVLVNLYISTTPYGKLRKLDYSKEVIKLMGDSTKEEIVSSKKYSETVSKALLENNFVVKNLGLYLRIEYKADKNFIKNMNKLVVQGYKDQTIIAIYKNLTSKEIDDLVKIGYVSDIEKYIKIRYFKMERLERYIAYKTKSEKDYEEVVTYVNIGLDKKYYDEEFVTTVKDLSSVTILVNKYNKLPDDYEPSDLKKVSDKCSKETSYLRKEAADAFEELCEGSINAGAKVLALSAYRSYKTQQDTWDDYLKKPNGLNLAYGYVAKPGYSEHQTGLAVDLASGSVPGTPFGNTKDYTWTINNAYKYGFIMRYETGTEKITGYNSEFWHIRYVGKDVAKYINKHEITFDEYIATR